MKYIRIMIDHGVRTIYDPKDKCHRIVFSLPYDSKDKLLTDAKFLSDHYGRSLVGVYELNIPEEQYSSRYPFSWDSDKKIIDQFHQENRTVLEKSPSTQLPVTFASPISQPMSSGTTSVASQSAPALVAAPQPLPAARPQ